MNTPLQSTDGLTETAATVLSPQQVLVQGLRNAVPYIREHEEIGRAHV